MKIWKFIKNNPFIIAEAGVNHLCSFKIGKKLIESAALAGANAIKFQSYKAEKLCTKDAPRFWEWKGEIKKNGSQYDSYSLLDGFGENEYRKLKKYCDLKNIEFMSTPFDNDAADYLDRIGSNIFKIASCDITNFPLIEHIAKKKKIVMLSTGAANMAEIKEAVNLIKRYTQMVVVMHCNLKYPTEDHNINLAMIEDLCHEFKNDVIGLSDHTIGTLTPAFAYLLNATVIEKHFTIDKGLDKSADHWLSADPKDLKEIVKNIHLAKKMLGMNKKICTDSELITRKYARRSVVANKNIKKGEVFTFENISCKRPGTGISPKYYKNIIGLRAIRNIKFDKLLTKDDMEEK